jgi:flagellar motor switch protein FliM
VGARERRIRLYDFRRPDKFSKEQLRALEVVFGHFARLSTTYFVSQLRTSVQLTVEEVQQATFGEFFAGLSGPLTVVVGALEPLAGKFLMVLDLTLTYALLDHLLGGAGQSRWAEARPPTEIEVGVLGRLLGGCLATLREAFAQVAEVQPRLLALESNPLFAQIVAPTEMATAVGLRVQLGSLTGQLSFCLPYVLLESMLPALSLYQSYRPTAESASSTWPLAEVPVTLVASLGTSRIRVRELLNLEVGDVVLLGTRVGHLLELLVEDRPKFQGEVGVRGRQLAFRVLRLAGGIGQ